jgi:hypothetical protein
MGNGDCEVVRFDVICCDVFVKWERSFGKEEGRVLGKRRCN